ncbi:uncharacterized protein LOC110811370 isoform X1 [Carica papaya]|uniref:uncharacterized protein LOC110811370 isoform X1 n=1 Tax=Carica papaya TaxID=3649 RepID=UPI000B8D143B|nr:uncharacterized protein LOC110811370 isoform X1 [Carica papaya]
MASSASKSVSTKKLKEHLQEAQEPFSLGIYLSEREYMMNCLSFTSKTSCCLMSSLTNLKRPCNNGINKKKIADAIRYLKLILYRISSPGDAQELSNSSSSSGDELVSEKTQQRQQIPKTDCIDLLTSPCPLFEYSFEEDSLLSKHRDGSLLTKVTQAFNLGNLKQKENRLLRRETLSGYAKETRSYTAQHQYYK